MQDELKKELQERFLSQTNVQTGAFAATAGVLLFAYSLLKMGASPREVWDNERFKVLNPFFEQGFPWIEEEDLFFAAELFMNRQKEVDNEQNIFTSPSP